MKSQTGPSLNILLMTDSVSQFLTTSKLYPL